jgi:hypothetical protein
MRSSIRVTAALVVAFAVAPSRAAAQAAVPQFRGDFGLDAGTQAPPGSYFGVFFDNYHAGRVRDGDGTSFPFRTTITAVALMGEYSSPYSIFGGRYAALIGIPWVTSSFDLPHIQLPSGKWGFSDLYLVPMQLGWKFTQADVLFGQGVFMPTGRLTNGDLHNTGLGMWSWESTLGSTLYADTTRQQSISGLLSYQVQSNVRGTDKRPGETLTLEGGIGSVVPHWNGKIGLVYYARWKLSGDQNYLIPPDFRHRDRYYAFGPELTATWKSKPAITVFTARYFVEGGNRSAPEGTSLILLANVYLPNVKAIQQMVAKR